MGVGTPGRQAWQGKGQKRKEGRKGKMKEGKGKDRYGKEQGSILALPFSHFQP